MKEYPIDLVDCLRVIWKRKILIIVGTLVCMVAGGVVNLRLPEIYRAEALISIGKTVNSRSVSLTPSFALFDAAKYLAESIPAEYGLNKEEALKYPLKVEAFRDPSMIKVILEGPERRKAEELLKGVVNKLIDDHLRRAESSVQPYRVYMGKLETDIKRIQKDIAQLEVRLKKVNTGETDPVMVMMIQNNLWQMRTNLRDMKQNLLGYLSVADRLSEYKTRVIGGVKAGKTPVKPKKKRNVMLAGVVGLMMSLFLAFFLEYLGKVMEREKKGDSV